MTEQTRKFAAVVLAIVAFVLTINALRGPRDLARSRLANDFSSPAQKPMRSSSQQMRERKWKAAFSADARRVISESRNVTIYALSYRGEQEFHGERIVRSVSIKNAAQCARLRQALYDGVSGGGKTAKEQTPDYGIRFNEGAKNVDVLYDSRPNNIYVFEGAKEIPVYIPMPAEWDGLKKNLDALLKK